MPIATPQQTAEILRKQPRRTLAQMLAQARALKAKQDERPQRLTAKANTRKKTP
jgi:hypothetical protein